MGPEIGSASSGIESSADDLLQGEEARRAQLEQRTNNIQGRIDEDFASFMQALQRGQSRDLRLQGNERQTLSRLYQRLNNIGRRQNRTIREGNRAQRDVNNERRDVAVSTAQQERDLALEQQQALLASQENQLRSFGDYVRNIAQPQQQRRQGVYDSINQQREAASQLGLGQLNRARATNRQTSTNQRSLGFGQFRNAMRNRAASYSQANRTRVR